MNTEKENEELDFFKSKTKQKKKFFGRNDLLFVIFFVLEPFLLIGIIGSVLIHEFNRENKYGIQITAQDALFMTAEKVQELSVDNQKNITLNKSNTTK
jgi:hypothetical protein